MKKILLIHILIFSFAGISVRAQVPSPSQMQQIRADDLTDEQVRQIVVEMKKNGYNINQIDRFAAQKGIPSSEVNKIKDRIRNLNLEKELETREVPEGEETGRGIDMEDMTYESGGKTMQVADGKGRIFGSELFNNKNLTFEPNLRMPTPPHYKLAAGDEIIIDVYGYNEVQHKLKVTPEGYIRIPNVGPVYMNGLTMEEAQIRIKKQLSTIFGGINTGNTFVQTSLGSIRSIQVLLIGEVKRPGTYTLPSLASVANALYVSGGPNNNGSFRAIQVIRGGSVAATFDLYSFLKNGDLTNNIILQDQDIVKVNPYKIRIELDGQVKRPAVFEVAEGETLQDIIDYAGGYSVQAYRDVIRASRINNKEREIISISGEEVQNFQPKSGDRFFIDAVLERFSNRVSITGAIFHPGDYALEKNMTVKGLIQKADGLMEIASLSRGIIRRLKEDYTPSIISFNLEDIISGKNDISLQREDSVVIFSKLQLKEKYMVKIQGLVNNPGYFDYADSMRLEDLVLIAGGLRDAASLKRVEISRRVRGKDYTFTPSDTQIMIVEQFDIRADLRSTPEISNFILQPFDEVSVRKSPTYTEQANVNIEGAVIYPGGYVIHSSKERISDLLRRAGGLKAEAYPEGAVLLRQTFVNESDSLLVAYKLDVFANKLKDSSSVNRLEGSLMRKEQLVGINLKEIIKSPGSKYDLYLEEGDMIQIPKRLQTVQLLGEIYFPKKVRYDRTLKFRDYIRNAGGFTSSALKRRSYVVYANGDVKSTRRIFFFNSYPRVKEGAEIYIPKKGEHRRGLNGQEILGMTTGFASLALILFTILDRSK